MKKLVVLSIILTLIVNLTSCKSGNKKEEKKGETVEKTAAFSLKSATNTITFTAYKTSEKLPVKGEFKTVNITTGGEGNTINEAVNNTEFSIPVSSIFTKDTSRDFKIRKFFFGVMEATELLSGKLVIENDSTGYTSIKMNGVNANIPFKYTKTATSFTMNATMNISDWNANLAIESLNEACKDLHKGADGVSKTWNDVALTIVSEF